MVGTTITRRLLAMIEDRRSVPDDYDWLADLQAITDVAELRGALAKRWPMFQLENLRRVAILGAAGEGRRLLSIFENLSIPVVGIFDGNSALHGTPAGALSVKPTADMTQLGDVPVIIASHRVLPALDSLAGLGVVAAPSALLQVLRPEVFEPHVFYDGLIEDLVSHRDRYQRLSTMLADDDSRRALNAMIGYRLTLDAELLRPVVEGDAFLSSMLLPLADDEVFVDGGAFDGDTVTRFIDRVDRRFEKILAFEPNPAAFFRLSSKFRDDSRITPFQKGLDQGHGKLRFSGDLGRAASFREDGQIEVEVVGIDEILAGDRVSYIKMNIEGSEMDALQGARRSIRAWRPKLAISAYHKPTHLWQVPFYIRELCPDYQIYLCVQDGGIIETVVYAIAANGERKAGVAPAAANADDDLPPELLHPVVPDMPPRLILDLRAACNLKCPMCPLHGPQGDEFRDDLVGEMSRDRARQILDEVMATRPLIQPQMYGEPLLTHDLKEHLRDMKSRGMAVAMNSNGLTLNEETAQFFVDNRIDAIFFSVDAVTSGTLKKVRGIDKLDKVENAVHRMLRVRGGADYPRIGVSFTLQEANKAELDAFIEKWTPIVDCVRIGKVFEDGRVQGMTEPKRRTPCPALYLTMPIHNDGTVSACCMDAFRETNMGNVFKDGVRGVWHGPELARFRHLHETGRTDEIPFCKNCNRWASYHYKEEVKGDLLVRESPEFTYYNRIDRLANWTGNLLGGHNVDPLAE